MNLKMSTGPHGGLIVRAEDYISTLPPLPEPYFWIMPYPDDPNHDHFDKAREKLLYVARKDLPYDPYDTSITKAWSHNVVAWYSGDGEELRHRYLHYGRKKMGETFRVELPDVSFDDALKMLETLACLGEL